MTHPARYLTVSLSLLALISCSKDPGSTTPPFQAAERQTHTVHEDIGRLVPADAVVFAHVSSLDGFEAKVKDLVKSFQPGAEDVVSQGLGAFYQSMDLKARDLDASKAAGVALSMGQMGPQPILILPAKSAKDIADISEAPVVISGSYVGLAKGAPASLADSASPLGSELPNGDVAVRVRLDQVLAPLRPTIDPWLDPDMLAQLNPRMQQDPASKAGTAFMVNWVKEFLDHAKTLEASMSLNDGQLDLGFTFRVAKGGPMDTGPAKTDRNLPYLAGSLPMPDASMVYLFSGAAQMQAAFDPMYQSMAKDMPAKEGQQFLAFMKRSQEFYKNMADEMVMAMDFTPAGLQAVALMQAKDTTKFTEDWDSFMTDYMKAIGSGGMFGAQGMTIAKEDPVNISGVQFKVFKLNVDFAGMMEAQGTPLPEEELEQMTDVMDAVLGKGGLTFGMGLDGNNLVMVMGNVKELGTKTIAALRSNKRHKLTMVEAVAGRLHVNPGFLFSVDVRRMFSQIFAIMPEGIRAQAPTVPQGPPVPVWFASAANGPVYELQVHVDLAGIADMVKEMKQPK